MVQAPKRLTRAIMARARAATATATFFEENTKSPSGVIRTPKGYLPVGGTLFFLASLAFISFFGLVRRAVPAGPAAAAAALVPEADADEDIVVGVVVWVSC
jgi:hypothetical protein